MCLRDSMDGVAGNREQGSTAYVLVAFSCNSVEFEIVVNAKPMQPTRIHRYCEAYISEVFSMAVRRFV